MCEHFTFLSIGMSIMALSEIDGRQVMVDGEVYNIIEAQFHESQNVILVYF